MIEGGQKEECLKNSFCRHRETSLDTLPCCKQKVEEHRRWRTAFNSVRMATDVLQDTKNECRVDVTKGRDGSVPRKPDDKVQKRERLEEFRSFGTSN